MVLNDISTPTLILDKAKTITNLKTIKSRCDKQAVDFRPHFKTHQSKEVGRWFRQAGITKITVSSVDMANYFALDGWKDILIAFPFNPREYEKILTLARRVNLTLTVPCYESAGILSKLASVNLEVMIKIDAGYGRSGIRYDDTASVIKTIEALELNSMLKVSGLLSHSGDTYKASNTDEISKIYKNSVSRLVSCRESAGRDKLKISVGDTPSASIMTDYGPADELRPGNFVFYDLMQYFLGSCSLNNISIAAACPIVDIQDNRKKIVIYGGGVHLSKEYIACNGEPVYGLAVRIKEDGWEFFENNIFVKSLSQEHGLIKSDAPLPDDFYIGNIIGIIPVHSCLTANLLGSYTLLDNTLIDHM